MKSLFAATIFLFSMSSYAHIEPGTWKGTASSNANCFMDVGDQTFENNLLNPFNERIAITIGAIKYSVRHPYSIDTKTGTVGFNHDLFEAVVPTETGAFAVQIQMIHTPAFEGPASFDVMEHNWKTGFKEVIHCTQLVKVY